MTATATPLFHHINIIWLNPILEFEVVEAIQFTDIPNLTLNSKI